jgi:mRNA interferase HigB
MFPILGTFGQCYGTRWMIRRAAPKAKVLYCDRAPFEVAGGDYRLIAAFDFRRQIAFVKFVGTHDEYDAIDALTVARF